MNVDCLDGEMFTDPGAYRSATELTPDQARGIKYLFESITDMQLRFGVTPAEPTVAELALTACIDDALHKEDVLSKAAQYYAGHKLTSEDVKSRQGIIDISIGPWGSAHGDHLTSWRNQDDRNALRQASIIEENTSIMTANYEAAKEAYKANLAEVSEHFDNHHVIYKAQAVKEARARGIPISYPPFTG